MVTDHLARSGRNFFCAGPSDRLARWRTHPGWSEDVTACRDFAALPDAAKSYVARVEALTGVPVELISVGPGRDQTISRADLFRQR